MFERTKEFFSGVAELFRETKAEVYLVAALGLFVGGFASCQYEHKRNDKLPLMFSEKHQLHLDAESKGTTVGPMEEYLTSTNDACMKVFERWNRSMSQNYKGDRDQKLAKELRDAIDPSNREHQYNLNNLLSSLPEEARIALTEISNFRDGSAKAKESANYFDGSWGYHRTDHYRTEWRTRTVTDSKGHSHTETYTVQVYSHSTHYYTYHNEAGEAANTTLAALVLAYPELTFDERLTFPSKTNSEGEAANDVSIEKKDKKKAFTKADYMKFAITWNTGSTLMQNLSGIAGAWENLRGDSKKWNVSRTTAHSTSYDTYSTWDSGPGEYQDAERALGNLRTSYQSIDEIVNGIEFVKTNAPELHQKINKYVGIVLNNEKGDAIKLRKEIIGLAKEMYQKNFKEGADVDRFRWYMVLLWTVLGLGAGALAGSFIDYTGDKILWQSNFRLPSFGSKKREPFHAIVPSGKQEKTIDELDKLLEEKPVEKPEPVTEQKQDDDFDFSKYNLKPKEEKPEYKSQDFPEEEQKGWQPRIAVPKFQFRKSAEFKRTK